MTNGDMIYMKDGKGGYVAIPPATLAVASLRDWFAGQALAAIATPHALKVVSNQGGNPSDVMAATAYEIANAMIAERTKATP